MYPDERDFKGNPKTGNPKNIVGIQEEYSSQGPYIPIIFLGFPFFGVPIIPFIDSSPVVSIFFSILSAPADQRWIMCMVHLWC